VLGVFVWLRVDFEPERVRGVSRIDFGGVLAGLRLIAQHFDRVVKVDTTGRRARAQAGISGPDLEAAWPESATQSPQLSVFDAGRMDRKGADIHGAMHRRMQSRVDVGESHSGVWCRSLLQSSAF
jgi:hypothetical protein